MLVAPQKIHFHLNGRQILALSIARKIEKKLCMGVIGTQKLN
jgi:hypothetical protein